MSYSIKLSSASSRKEGLTLVLIEDDTKVEFPIEKGHNGIEKNLCYYIANNRRYPLFLDNKLLEIVWKHRFYKIPKEVQKQLQ